jgi:hypothetical protein
MAVGREVRLRYAYLVTCRQVVKDADGNVVELRCTYDPASRGGNAPDGRKVKATLHWVSGRDARPAEVRLYSTLFNRPDPGADGDLDADLNPSLTTTSLSRIFIHDFGYFPFFYSFHTIFIFNIHPLLFSLTYTLYFHLTLYSSTPCPKLTPVLI